jgi:hypothetical protein
MTRLTWLAKANLLCLPHHVLLPYLAPQQQLTNSCKPLFNPRINPHSPLTCTDICWTSLCAPALYRRCTWHIICGCRTTQPDSK